MKICARFAPAYSPVSGEPAKAAPLETRMTDEPEGRGHDSAALQK
jgi:hypothetical protein